MLWRQCLLNLVNWFSFSGSVTDWNWSLLPLEGWHSSFAEYSIQAGLLDFAPYRRLNRLAWRHRGSISVLFRAAVHLSHALSTKVFIPAYLAKLHYNPVVYDYDEQHGRTMRRSSECFFNTNVTGNRCS